MTEALHGLIPWPDSALHELLYISWCHLRIAVRNEEMISVTAAVSGAANKTHGYCICRTGRVAIADTGRSRMAYWRLTLWCRRV
jgi:hypothetical protein